MTFLNLFDKVLKLKKDCFNSWCKLTAGCMDCLHDRCGSFSNRCPSVSRYAPCYKTPSLPGCLQVVGDEMLKCGLGLACDRRLFNFIKGKLFVAYYATVDVFAIRVLKFKTKDEDIRVRTYVLRVTDSVCNQA